VVVAYRFHGFISFPLSPILSVLVEHRFGACESKVPRRVLKGKAIPVTGREGP
jgi:hypothetical protein